jgi:hypothetical protein
METVNREKVLVEAVRVFAEHGEQGRSQLETDCLVRRVLPGGLGHRRQVKAKMTVIRCL